MRSGTVASTLNFLVLSPSSSRLNAVDFDRFAFVRRALYVMIMELRRSNTPCGTSEVNSIISIAPFIFYIRLAALRLDLFSIGEDVCLGLRLVLHGMASRCASSTRRSIWQLWSLSGRDR